MNPNSLTERKLNRNTVNGTLTTEKSFLTITERKSSKDQTIEEEHDESVESFFMDNQEQSLRSKSTRVENFMQSG